MIFQGLQIALESLWSNKMRSFLSMLGIVIGVGAVIAIVSVGTGSTKQITSRIANLGSNMITVYPRALRGQFGRLSSFNSQQKFTLELSEHLEEFCPSVKQVIPVKQINGRLFSDNVNINSVIIGTRAGYTEINSYEIAQGVFVSKEDDLERRQVIVLGDQVARDLFENVNPIGQTVRVNYDGRVFQFTVVGVMKEKGGSMAGNLDERVYVPLSVVMDRLTAQRYVDSLLAQAYSSEQANNAVLEIEYFMKRHLEDDKGEQFRITSQDEILDTVSSVSNTMSMMLGGIAAISLLVGGIGIMNIMLVSVTERTREIGIRKALGAKNKNILFQFLMESLSLSSLGGVAGIGFGWIATFFLSKYGNWPFIISTISVILAFGFAIFIGVFFGLYPAMKAARMNPVDALRYE